MAPRFTIPGYDLIELLHEGRSTVVYRGRSQSDPQPLILKILKSEYPSLDQIARLKHEYQIIENLDLTGIVKVCQLLTHYNRLALVYEDFGGQSLNQLLGLQSLPLSALLRIAIQLAEAVASLHHQQIIHKDIKPANIIINSYSEQVKLTDFSIASRLNQETPQIINPNLLEGTLAYMSPEQTGRMNRTVDYRSDFYSLGVTFYEMLTGQLPFQSTDPLELIHCHIAKSPLSLYAHGAHLIHKVPQALSDIVMKLMAKNAEDRYQSAVGLKSDLEFCLEQLQTIDTIPLFTLGKHDRTAQLLIPQKLYGREQEVQILLAAFARIACPKDNRIAGKVPSTHPPISPSPSRSELVLVAGYSGIGKSSLVNEVLKPIARGTRDINGQQQSQQRGYFIAGKFDQFKRNIPYAPIIQAFRSLIQQLLTESSAQLQRWQEKLLAALKSNGQVIIDVIPEVELIIAQQPAVPELGATEAQNRFNQVFQSFIQVFTQPEHPLVLFLDDLQWADAASLKLIQTILDNPNSQFLLLIGAYRDNEVNPIHPLMRTIEEIKQAGVEVSSIMLRPLKLTHVREIIIDAFEGTNLELESKITALAELLFDRTQGNPFFLGQLLKSLHQEQLFRFDFFHDRWHWDLQAIRSADVAEKDVVELVAQNIEKLPTATQTMLKLAACVGNRFNIDVLATVGQMSLSDTAAALEASLRAGFVLPLNSDYKIPLLFASDELQALDFDQTRVSYRFLHDRVQQAAYSLIPASQRKITHLRIGQLLLKNTSELETSIFEIVNSLNLGADLIEHQTEKTELAQLNLLAGQKAKAAAAYEAASNYLNQGMTLLADHSWQTDYHLSLTLSIEAAEVAYLNTNYERSEQLVNVVEAQALNVLDKVKAYELKIQFYIAQLEMWKSIETGLYALAMLGFPIASQINWNHFSIHLPELDELPNSPEMTDPIQLAALRILTALISTAYQTQSETFRWIVLTQLKLCVEHGHSPLAAFSYMTYAWLCSTIGAFDRAYQSGQIGLKLLEQFNAKELQPNLLQIFESFVRHYKEHVRETFAPFVESIQTGIETGKIEYAGYSAMNHITHLFFSGVPLAALKQTQAEYVELLFKLKQEFQICYTLLWQQVTLNLQEKLENPCTLIGVTFDETVVLPRLQAARNNQSLFAFYAAKLILNYIFQNYSQAVDAAALAEPYASSGAGLMLAPVYEFYAALARLADYNSPNRVDQSQQHQAILNHQHHLRLAAESAPMNYLHKYDLVTAELARIEGQITTAMTHYDQAIQGALKNGYIQEVALANERTAEFYLTQGKKHIAQGYMTDAYYAYIQWGAFAKVQHLEEKYASLIIRSEATVSSIATIDTVVANAMQSIGSTSSSTNVLDLATVMKAAQAISGELNLHHLLEKLLSIILEHAGASKGCLILEKNGQLFVEAVDNDSDRLFVTLQSTPVETSSDVPIALINYVSRTQHTKVFVDASQDEFFNIDPYIQKHQLQSILCAPIFYQGKFIGIVYLENALTAGAFTAERLELLKLLTAQAAIAIENARLYSREQEQSQQLRESLQQLQQAQLQLVQNEKMATLGNLVAGVAHEINNPLGFLKGSLNHTEEYVHDLLQHLHCYQHSYPNPLPNIQAHAKDIELEFLTDDLPKMLSSMKVAIERIQTISTSLRAFSRSDTNQKTICDIHEGIDSTLLILKYRLKANEQRSEIEVVKQYGELPPVECFSGQLNQVFMNILANAIDALEEAEGRGQRVEGEKPMIWIQTEVVKLTQSRVDWVAIRIRDNGMGIPDNVKQRIFDHLFTTKIVGKGTGLGLAIAHQIIVEKHGGTLEVNSTPGQGAEFVITIPRLSEG